MSVATPSLSRPEPPARGRSTPAAPHRRSRAGILPLGLAALICGGMYFAGALPRLSRREALAEASASARARELNPRVKVVRPTRNARPGDLRLPGDLLPSQESPLHARTGGYLKRVLVDIGDHVEAGQLLAEIDAPEMDDEFERAQANLGQAKADLQLADARKNLAGLNLKRSEALHRRSAASGQEVDEQVAAFRVTEATVASAQATVSAREADVRRLDNLRSFLRITAPFRGTITARAFDPGALIAADGAGQKPLFRIAQDETLKAVVSVPQAYAAAIREGQEVQVYVREFPGRSFQGRVARTARAVEPASRTLRTEVELPNPDRALYSGMYIEAGFARLVAAPLTVPAVAVLTGPEGPRVATVATDGRVRWQPIEVRRDLGGDVEIASGLSGDETLVASPSPGLADGAHVDVIASQNINKRGSRPDSPARAGRN